jgi:hypothetical protein
MGSFFFQAPKIPDRMGRGAMIILGLFALMLSVPLLMLLGGYLAAACVAVVEFFRWLVG